MEWRSVIDEIVMRSSTLFLATWLIWITAKGRLSAYWQLATVSAAPASSTGAGAPGTVDAMPAVPGIPPIQVPDGLKIPDLSNPIPGFTGPQN